MEKENDIEIISISTTLLTCAIMVKNEEERILKTIKTIADHIDHLVILDTGSTDNTIKVIQEYSLTQNYHLHIHTKEFVNFSENRNYMLNKCLGLSKFILLLDSNDEVQHPEFLRPFLKRSKKFDVFLSNFYWINDNGIKGNDIRYYKISVIRNYDFIRYVMPTHEFIDQSNCKISTKLMDTNYLIFQDRAQDKSSQSRFEWDLEQLIGYLKEHGPTIRTYRFICQTLQVMNNYDDLLKYSKEWITFIDKHNSANGKYQNEIFSAYMYRALSGVKTGEEEISSHYVRAYEYSLKKFGRVEPFFELAKAWGEKGDKKEAYYWLKRACKINKPKLLEESNEKIYDYYRWDFLMKLSQDLDHQKGIDYAIQKLAENGHRPDINSLGTSMTPNQGENNSNENSKKVDFKDLNPNVRAAIEKSGINLNPSNDKKLLSQEELKEKTFGHKLYLIVPYRDREKQLAEFIPHMMGYCRYLGMEYSIMVVEQAGDKFFNKCSLFNFALKFIEKYETNPEKVYCCFHDVDILPTKGTNYYRPNLNEVDHIYGYIKSVGGIFLINYPDILKMNGFSNLFHGLGWEDNEIARRIETNGLKINRDFFYKRYDEFAFKELDKDTNDPLKKLEFPKSKKNEETLKKDIPSEKDGLKQILSIENSFTVLGNQDYLHLKVDIQKIEYDYNESL